MTATSAASASLSAFGAVPNDAEIFPLAPLQEGMFVHHARGAHAGVDVEQIVVQSAEPLDVAALEAAWNEVVAASPTLRTSIEWRDRDEPQQRVHSDVRVRIHTRDLSHAADRDGAAIDFLAEDRQRGIALDAAPLMRLTLLHLADDDWRLVWTFHHILLDGRAFAAILEDVFDRYDGVGGARLRSHRSYADYVGWTRTRDAGVSDEFWRDTLRGFVAPTPVPLREPRREPRRPGAITTADCERRLNVETSRALEALARRERVSVGTLVQAAWALVLSRYAGTPDVVFGVVAACGDYAGDSASTADAISLFLHTIPMRFAISSDATLSEWGQEVRGRWRGVRANKHSPLSRVRACAELAGSEPLFETIVMFEQYELDERLRARGGAWSHRRVRLYEQNGFPITVAAFAGTRLLLRLEFDPTQLSHDAARTLCDRMAAVLTSMATRPDSRVADVEMWLEGERERVVHEWNATARDYPPETLDSLLRAQALSTPSVIAVIADGAALTYAALDARANALATELVARGVGAGAMVGVCIERSLELVVAIVGVVRSGAAYVPLDPDYPLERLAFMVEDSAVPIVITSAALRDRVSTLPISVAPALLVVDAHSRVDESVAPPAHVPTREDPAYMIYTSGSTGRPKGALNAHGAIANRLQWMQAAYALGAADAVLQKTPASFDVSVWEFFWPLITGARLVMAAPGGHRDPAYLRDTIRSERISVLHFVPSMLRAFLDEPEIERCAMERGGTLRDVICSGEALPVDLQREFFARLPGVRLHNLYGPTEAAVDVTAWECDAASSRGTVPIGRPIANTRIYILDGERRPVPIAVPGELYIGGVQVGKGYWHRPELTAERFLDDPFATQTGGRMYRTGDRARWTPDGEIEYLGRVDDQVKIRGQRVELGEIEAALAAQSEVRAAAVAIRNDGHANPQLVAYCVPRDSDARDTVTRAALRERLARTLPSHMIPAAIVWIDALPLGVTGKLDRRALPAVDAAELTVDDPERILAPRTEVETAIASIFAETLGVAQIGVDQSFFDVGGDSILLMRAIARARRAGFAITLREVFAHPTVEALAAVAAGRPTVIVAARATDERAPLTPIQQWFFDGVTDGRDHWNQSVLLRTRSRCDAERLRAAIERVVRHHAALRSRFACEDGICHQEPGPTAFDFGVVDLTGRGSAADALLRQAATTANESLSLADGRVVAARLIRGDDHDMVLLVAHHAVVDGVSWRTIVDDLEASYASDGGPSWSLDAAPTSFADWSHALAALASRGRFSQQRDYWTTVAADARPFPRDGAAVGPSIAANTRTILGTLDCDETSAVLRDVARRHGVQINDVLLTALGAGLAPLVGGPAFVVDLEGHGREDVVDGADVSRTVGWFTSLYPVAVTTEPGLPVAERLYTTRDRLRAVPDRGIGYGVLRYTAADGDLAGHPRDVVFNYLGQLDRSASDAREFTELPARGIGELRSPRSARLHLVELNCAVVDGCFEIAADFDATVIHTATIGGVVDRFIATLRSLIAETSDPDAAAPSVVPDIEATYAATPLQRMFHVHAGAADDPGVQQWRFTIRGEVRSAWLRDAWQATVDRHTILRTSLVEDDGVLRQAVYRRAVMPWFEVDLRDVPSSERGAALRDVLARDRARGISFVEAPLMRVTLVRLGDVEYELVWTNHHAILDRWSWSLVLRDVGSAYDALAEGRSARLPRGVPFAAYVDWLASRDVVTAESFWREQLAGLAPRRLAGSSSQSEEGALAATLELGERRVRELRARAATHGVSVNALIQGAWALTLAHVLGVDDVAIGVVVSGRPDELVDADEIVGPTIANVPLRVRVEPAVDVGEWLRTCARTQVEVQEHGWLAPARIEHVSGVRGALFQTLTVFHHGADDAVAGSWLRGDASIVAVRMPTHTQWPVTIVVSGDRGVRVTLEADLSRVDRAAAEVMLPTLDAALDALAAGGSMSSVTRRLPIATHGAAAAADAAAGASLAADERPASALERILAGMWCDVLGVAALGRNSSFLALGGNSLAAMKLASRVGEVLHVTPPVRVVFEASTLAAFADAIRRHAAVPGTADRIAEIVERISTMSDAEVGETLGVAERAPATGVVE